MAPNSILFFMLQPYYINTIEIRITILPKQIIFILQLLDA